jgi:hypothetical protein
MRETEMQTTTKTNLRAAQQDLYAIHAHISESMNMTGGVSTEEWQMLYSVMQAVGGLTDVIGVYLGDHASKVVPADPYPANITLDDPSDLPAFTPPF